MTWKRPDQLYRKQQSGPDSRAALLILASFSLLYCLSSTTMALMSDVPTFSTW